MNINKSIESLSKPFIYLFITIYYRVFLARGADVEAKNNKGETPLEVMPMKYLHSDLKLKTFFFKRSLVISFVKNEFIFHR